MGKIVVKDKELYEESLKIIKSLYGEDAQFREGQYESIEATLLNHRTLVVQRTGWGKSLVYPESVKLRIHKSVRMPVESTF